MYCGKLTWILLRLKGRPTVVVIIVGRRMKCDHHSAKTIVLGDSKNGLVFHLSSSDRFMSLDLTKWVKKRLSIIKRNFAYCSFFQRNQKRSLKINLKQKVCYLMFLRTGAKPSCSQCVNIYFSACVLCLLEEQAADDDTVKTLTDAMRMDHTTLQSINTSMRNAWFCSAPRGCIQQHSSTSLPSLSRFTRDFPALCCTETTLMETT